MPPSPSPSSLVLVRPIVEADVEEVARLYRAVYGEDYPFKEFYDPTWIKRGLYDPTIRWYVGDLDGRLLGSAAVMLNAGDVGDAVAEVGRLVVHPDARGHGLAHRLIDRLMEDVEAHSDVAFAECRTAHVGSQIIFHRRGFGLTGIEPIAYHVPGPESVVMACRLSDHARGLRDPRPVMIPAAASLAAQALASCGIEPDVIPESRPEPYPRYRAHAAVRLEPLQGTEVRRLLRFSREKMIHPEVFGAFRLEYGMLKLKEHDARHLGLRRDDSLLGGLGYTWDPVERKVQIFEFVALDDLAKGTLLERAVAWLESELSPRYLGIDVQAGATRIQQTLALLGFVPVAYMPSLVFSLGVRYDVIKFVKLREEPKLDHWMLTDEARPVAETARDLLHQAARGAEVGDLLHGLEFFAPLTDVQRSQVASFCLRRTFGDGEWIFPADDPSQSLFVVIDGAVEILQPGSDHPVATVQAGEVFGEISLIDGLPRTLGARSRGPTTLVSIGPEDFDHLLQTWPETGVVLLRQIAATLGARLRQTDAWLNAASDR